MKKIITLSIAVVFGCGSPLLRSNFLAAQIFTKNTTLEIVTAAEVTGSSWVDYDNDGDLDAIVFANNVAANNPGGYHYIFQNNCGTSFTRVTSGLGGGIEQDNGSGWADIDSDGDVDLYIPEHAIYYNNGNGTFNKITGSPLIDPNFHPKARPAFGDFDNDGDLDVIVTTWSSHQVTFFRNDGGGNYSNIPAGDVTNAVGTGTAAQWGDYDNDGYMDIFVSTIGNGGKNKLYKNNANGTFTQQTTSAVEAPLGSGYGGSWLDYDNDKDLDLYVPNSFPPGFKLFNNDGAGNFTEVSASAGLTTVESNNDGHAWGDVDNDGDLDLYQSTFQKSIFWLNNGNGTFTENTTDIVVNDILVEPYGASMVDFDNDGDLDLFVATNSGFIESLFYTNNGNSNSWVNIRCKGTSTNAAAIGARVYVKATIGGVPKWQFREMNGNPAAFQHNNNVANERFGLGNATIIDSIKVIWPKSGITQYFTNVIPNRFIDITEGVNAIVNSKQCGAGTTCEKAVDLGQGDNCQNNMNMQAAEMWLKVIPDSSAVLAFVTSASPNEIKKMSMYSGTCSVQTLLGTDLSIENTDTLPALYINGIVQGDVYLKIEKRIPAASPVFGICVMNLPTPTILSSSCPGKVCNNLLSNGDFETPQPQSTTCDPVWCTPLPSAYPLSSGQTQMQYACKKFGTCPAPIDGYTNKHAVSNAGISPYFGNDPCSPITPENDDHTSTGNNYFLYGDAPSENCVACSTNCNNNSSPPALACSTIAWTHPPVAITLGTQYKFSMWYKQIGAHGGLGSPLPPATLWVNINGVQQTASVQAYGCGWQNFCFFWTANTIQAVIDIWCNGTPSAGGYDFGIDDIEFGIPLVVNAGSDFNLCSNSTSYLNASASGGTPPYTFSWAPTTGLSCPTCPSTVVSGNINPTNYVVTVTDALGCVASDNVKVNIFLAPVADFTFTTDENCMGNTFSFDASGSGGGIYSWDFGDGCIIGPAANIAVPPANCATGTYKIPSHVYTKPGEYLVKFTNSNGLCNTIVTKIVRVTPSTSSYNTNCCSRNFSYTHNGNFTISTPADVNVFFASGNFVSIKNTLTITNNQTITFSGKVVRFGPWGKLIVEPGSALILNQTTLNGILFPCTINSEVITQSLMWQGVEVWGDATKNQTSGPSPGKLYQGKITIQNNSFIRNAHNAVAVGQRQPLQAYFIGPKGGGIILATTNSSFINNGIGVRFGPYYNFPNNLGRMDNCKFICGTLLDPGYDLNNPAGYQYPNAYNKFYGNASSAKHTFAHGHLFGTKGVTFRDNTFDNAVYGVLSMNSSTKYLDANNSGESNIFTNIETTGIRHEYFWSTLFGNRIEFNRFDGSYGTTGAPIIINGGKNDYIRKNNIDPFTPNNYFVGIGVFNSSAPTIVDNFINNCFVGVIVSNTGNYGLVGFQTQGNIFTRCANGTWTVGNNSNLQIRCNTYNNLVSTNYVRNWNINGPLANQGNFPTLTDKDPSGNFFVQTPVLTRDLYSLSPFNYRHHSKDQNGNSLTVTPVVLTTIAGNVLTSASFINTGFTKGLTSCDPIPCPPPCINGITILKDKFSLLQSEFNAVLSNLDNGQTAQLVAAINGTTSNGNLKSMLLQNSPLSDEVLVAFLNRNGTPPGHVKDVVIPNSPVSDAVRPLMYIKLASMPPGIAQQIRAAQTSNAFRTLTAISLQMESTKISRQGLVTDAISFYSDNDLQQDAINLLEAENTLEGNQALAATYIANGDYVTASSKLSSMSASTIEEQLFIDLQTSLLSIYSSGRSVFEMGAAEEQLVRDIASSPGSSLARTNACAILFTVFNEDCGLDLSVPSQKLANTINNAPAVTEETGLGFLGESYPNPATNKVYIPYYLPQESGGIMNIFDMNGKTLGSFILMQGENALEINTTVLPGGVYAYSISIDGTLMETRRMVIINNR